MSADPSRPLLYVITGLSGSGKSVALKTLEDLDVHCTDNLPVELLPQFVRSVTGGEGGASRLAVGIDVRNASDLARIPEWLSALGEMGIDHQLVFFETRDDTLLKRYSDTRRKHPLSHDGLALADAIELERVRLRPLKAIADLVMDTSDMNVHQMRREVITALGVGTHQDMSLLFESFAYKRGLPADADFVFDARALPNPHWDARLRPLSGRDASVREYLEVDPQVQEFVAQVEAFLDTWVPRFEAGTRSYLTIAFGCTGGRHRSVYLAERLAAHCREKGRDGVLTFHRELD
ncbi:nucleotide-binding protein [Arenimonas soli]|uniref:Nucleotide-binding protein n=1 Tax=Arenimonas soli TaxID=2269504 RepID=A0ABQ1HQY2_9GAMM|nr:RNase adapter RapZ [Arenimonas soli]GGA85543.1 nucleotide-binding protein [Arenimonas soli]